MAVAYLAQHFGREFLSFRLPFLEQLDPRRVEVVLRMIDHKVNSPLTSSCGRLFDAVAALAGIRLRINYEAQAAIELEMAMHHADDGAGYPLAFVEEGSGWLIDTRPLFETLVHDLQEGRPASFVSRRFHNGLVDAFARLATLLRERTGLNRVCLSGGSFQNVSLLEGLERRLKAERFEVFTHSEVPPGDGGLSLGQALVAAHQAR